MKAWPEKSVATRLNDSTRLLRPRLPVLIQADPKKRRRYPIDEARLDQTSDSHLRLRASRAEGPGSLHPSRYPELCGNREEPCQDCLGSKKSWPPPKRRE